MGSSPCGCKSEEEADGKSASERQHVSLNAAFMRSSWGCPGRYSDAIPRTAEHLDVDQRAALDAVQDLTGFGANCTTCPRKYAALPFMQRAQRAYAFTEKGCPEYVEPEPPYALIEAIEAIGTGVAECHTHTLDASIKKSNAANPPR